MADTKVSAMPEATSLDQDDELYVIEDGVSKRIKRRNLGYLQTVDTLAELQGLDTSVISDGAVIKVISYYSNGDVELTADYKYNASGAKSGHNGGTIISPTVPWDGVAGATHTNFLNGTGETDGGGVGVFELQKTSVQPSDFGAVSGGVDQGVIINKLFASAKRISISEQYGTSIATFPQSNSTIIFYGEGELVATQIITGDECVIKIVDATFVNLLNPRIDAGNYSGNSGLIIRENTAEVTATNIRVKNAVWDAARGGGRGVIIESNTGTQGRITIDGVHTTDVGTVFALNGYNGSRKNAVNVSNIVGVNATELIALFGNGAGYPHTGDTQQCNINNVVGYNIERPIRFDRASNATIDNVYVYNSAAYGTISSVIQGVSNNVKCTITYEGDCANLFNATPWHQDNSSTDTGVDTHKGQFNITHRGTCSNTLLGAAITRSTLVSNTTFDINYDVVTGDVVGNTQINANTTARFKIYSTGLDAYFEGWLSKLGALSLSAWAAGSFTPTVVGTSTAGVGTYSIQQGNYDVVGRRVYFNIYLAWSAHTGTGNMRIGGFPIAPTSATNTHAACSVAFPSNLALTAGNVISAYVDPTNGQISLVQTPSGGGAAAGVPLDTAGVIMVSGMYLI